MADNRMEIPISRRRRRIFIRYECYCHIVKNTLYRLLFRWFFPLGSGTLKGPGSVPLKWSLLLKMRFTRQGKFCFTRHRKVHRQILHHLIHCVSQVYRQTLYYRIDLLCLTGPQVDILLLNIYCTDILIVQTGESVR